MSALDSGIWEETVRIRSFDADMSHRASLDALCRYFLDAAWAHAEHLGVGFQELQKDNRVWVLSRLLVHVERQPVWGETIRVHTWPRAATNLFALRDFEMLDAGGKRTVAGSSAWLVLGGASRRPQRIERVVSKVVPVPRSALEEDPAKITEPKGPALRLSIPVRYLDIDVNGHVTSARYIGWMLDSYPVVFHLAHTLRRLEINYTGETRASDTVSVYVEAAGSGEHNHVISNSNGSIVCRARLEWAAHESSVS